MNNLPTQKFLVDFSPFQASPDQGEQLPFVSILTNFCVVDLLISLMELVQEEH